MMPVALLILTAVVLTAFTVRSGLDGGVQAAVNVVLGQIGRAHV